MSDKTPMDVYKELFSQNYSEDIASKAKAFDTLAELYYNRNFGALSKSEIDLLMFSFYMDAMIKKNINENNVLNYNNCSDYEIAKTLGITQTKVRNLKEKKQQRYPIEFDWRKSLAGLYKYVTYDDKTGYINLLIPDRNLFLDIQNEIENNGGFVDIKLNSKLLNIRPEYFIELVLSTEPDSTRKSAEKKLKILLKDHAKQEINLEEKTIGASIKEAVSCGAPIVSILSGLNAICSPTNIYSPMIAKLAALIVPLIK